MLNIVQAVSSIATITLGNSAPLSPCCDHIVEFYDTEVDNVACTQGVQGQFLLAQGPGRYPVRIVTDVAGRGQIVSAEQQIIMSASPSDVLEQLQRLDGQERYDITADSKGCGN